MGDEQLYNSVYNRELVHQLVLDPEFSNNSNPIIMIMLQNLTALKAERVDII